MFDLLLGATIASLLIVCCVGASRSRRVSVLTNAASRLPLLRFSALRRSRPGFPCLQLPNEFAFDRALEAYEELIDVTCAVKRE